MTKNTIRSNGVEETLTLACLSPFPIIVAGLRFVWLGITLSLKIVFCHPAGDEESASWVGVGRSQKYIQKSRKL